MKVISKQEQVNLLREELQAMTLEELDKEMDKVLILQGSMEPTAETPPFILEIDKEIKKGTDALLSIINNGKLVLAFRFAGPVVQLFEESIPTGKLSWADVKFVQHLIAGTVIKSIDDAKEIKTVLEAFWKAHKVMSEIEERQSHIADIQIEKENLLAKEAATGLKANTTVEEEIAKAQSPEVIESPLSVEEAIAVAEMAQ